MTDKEKLAIEFIFIWGGIGGEHHKVWLIDQVLRILAGSEYEKLVEQHLNDSNEDDDLWEEEWDCGVAP